MKHLMRRPGVVALVAALVSTLAVAGAARSPTYPAGARTGVVRVDRILAAMQKQDADRMADLVGYTKLPCTSTKPPGYTWIKCKPDEPEGTLVDTFWLGSCDAASVRADELDIRSTIQEFMNGGRKLYAVYGWVGRKQPPARGFGVIFSQEGEHHSEASILSIRGNGDLIGIGFSACGHTPETIWESAEGRAVLAPRTR